MIRWEYHTELSIDLPHVQALGAIGWEMCGMVMLPMGSIAYYFKRPLPQPMKKLFSRTECSTIRRNRRS